jgi:hypothetical protein
MEERVVVSLTTSPARIHEMEAVVDDIASRQTRLPDAIYVNIPERFRRTGEPYDIPAWLMKKPRVQIVRFPEDHGPISKLLPTLILESDPDTMIVICDDDTAYDPEWVSSLVDRARVFPDDVITTRCDDQRKNPTRHPLGKCTIPLGFSGVLFRRKHFGDDFKTYVDEASHDSNCFMGDDYVIGSYLDQNNIRIRNLNRHIKQHGYGFREDALHRITTTSKSVFEWLDAPFRYEQCRQHLKAKKLTKFSRPSVMPPFLIHCASYLVPAVVLLVVLCRRH